MTDYTTRPFTREKFTDLQSLVTDSALARWPEIPYFLNSDVVWQLPGSNAKDNIRLWYDEHGIAAYAWFTPNSPMTFDLRSDIDFAHPLCDDLIFWCEARARSMPGREPWLIDLESMAQWEDALTNNLAARPSEHRYLQVFAMDKDLERGEFLERHGFHATQHFEWKLARSLDVDIPPASLPPGMKLRHVTPQDFEERVAVHRDAWFKSGFTLERYLAVRDIDGYTP
ncbi:MAG TPA: hypothetical protein VJ998_12810, partial [Pseudomonadales bacterium]|nr:hypothetical protein [Pseudomonadales bacterium]